MTTVEYQGKTYNLNDNKDLLNEDGSIFKTYTDYDNEINPKIEIDGKQYKLDADGNALNEDGSIFKAKNDLQTNNNEETILIDEVEYTLDKDGNAIKDGTVFKTKREIDELIAAMESTIGVDINKISESIGIVLTDNDNKPVTFENTEAGISNYITKVYEGAVQTGAQKAVSELYSINPIIEDFVNYVKLNNTAEGFNKTVKFSTLKLDEDNEDNLTYVIREARKRKGDNPEEINNYIAWAKADKKLLNSAKISLDYLKSVESEEDAILRNKVKQREQLEQEQLNNISNIVKQVATTKTLEYNGEKYVMPAVIPIKLKDGVQNADISYLNDYLTVKQEYTINGKKVYMTAFEADEYVHNARVTPQDKILKALQYLSGMTVDKLITAKINTKQVKSIKTNSNNNHSTTPPNKLIIKTKF